MIVRSRYAGDRMVAFADFGDSTPPPRTGTSWASSGVLVTDEAAFGLPAVAEVIESVASTIAALSLLVYRDGGDYHERATDAWQYRLLHDYPSEESNGFEWLYDIVVSLECSQNAFIQKTKLGREVVELRVLDPQRLSVRRDRETGEKRFDYWRSAGDVERDLGPDQILHIRGFSPRPGAVCGVSRIQMHRDALGAGLAMQQFEGDFFRNYSVPPVVLKFGQHVLRDQAAQWRDDWNAAHARHGERFGAAAIGQGGDITTLPINLEDMLFVETKRLSIEDDCRIFHWPKEMVGIGEIADETAFSTRLLKHFVFPRLRRIERALAADQDLFPITDRLFPEFLVDSLERADIRTRYEAYKAARQAGWATANEIRRKENMPPDPRGDELQATPVGGAPNTEAPDASSNGHGKADLERLLTNNTN